MVENRMYNTPRVVLIKPDQKGDVDKILHTIFKCTGCKKVLFEFMYDDS